MINIPHAYSQRDLRWAFKQINKAVTFWNIGCTDTALTMLLEAAGYKFTPDTVESMLQAHGGFNSLGQILWGVVSQVFYQVVWKYRYYNSYDNDKVLSYINRGIPVMVEVLINKQFHHWVLFIGDHKMIDPLDGNTKSTSTYPVIGWSEFDIPNIVPNFVKSSNLG